MPTHPQVALVLVTLHVISTVDPSYTQNSLTISSGEVHMQDLYSN